MNGRRLRKMFVMPLEWKQLNVIELTPCVVTTWLPKGLDAEKSDNLSDHVQNLWNLRLGVLQLQFPWQSWPFPFPTFFVKSSLPKSKLSLVAFKKISEGRWQMQKVTLFSKIDFFLFHSLHFQEQNVQKTLTLCTLLGALLWFALGFKLLFKFSRAYDNLKIKINSQCT